MVYMMGLYQYLRRERNRSYIGENYSSPLKLILDGDHVVQNDMLEYGTAHSYRRKTKTSPSLLMRLLAPSSRNVLIDPVNETFPFSVLVSYIP